MKLCLILMLNIKILMLNFTTTVYDDSNFTHDVSTITKNLISGKNKVNIPLQKQIAK